MKNSKDFLNYLSDKLDILDSRLDHISETLLVQQEQLKEHMRRSELNEEAIVVLKDEMKPMQHDWLRLKFLGKVAGVVAGFITLVYYSVVILKGL